MKKLYLTLSLSILFGFNNLFKSQSEIWGLNAAGGDGFGTLYSMQTGNTSLSSQYTFTGNPGFNPQSTKLLQALNGKLYGMTNLGGSSNLGIIFEYDTLTNAYVRKIDFNGTNGANPKGALIQAANGKLYGMTQLGGSNNSGVIFEYNTATNAFNVLVNLTGTTGSFPGSQPAGALVQPDPSSTKLYGMTRSGGINDKGVLFEYDYGTNTYTAKLDFNGNVGSALGGNPNGQLVKAISASSSTTTLFGLTSVGGTNDRGVLFEYDYALDIFTKKFDFANPTGASPQGSLLLASNGRLYGTGSANGGSTGGVIFEYIISTNTYNKLQDLTTGLGSIGGTPLGDLMEATNGKLYGMTRLGGATNAGVIFEVDVTIPASPVYNKRVDLSVANGSQPFGSLMQVSTGKIYGLTSAGGTVGGGVIFHYNPSSHVYTKKIDLNLSSGGNPNGYLMQASNGKLYGLGAVGGNNASVGVIFEYDKATSTYTKKIDFTGSFGTNPGSTPLGGLIQVGSSKLYGVTSAGGSSALGTLFSYDFVSGVHTKHVDFTAAVGSVPYGSLVQFSGNNKLYGMTKQGGSAGQGVIFEFDPTTNVYTKKIDLSLAVVNSYSAFGSMVETSGKLYGMTQLGGAGLGTIFEYDPTTNTFTKKIDFTGTTGAAQGSLPFGSLVQTATVGILYGMTKTGGANDLGVIFEYNASTNAYTKKYDMIAANGSLPLGSLIRAANGNLYGVTNAGGANSSGVLFEYNISTNTYTKKFDFAIATGNSPTYTQLLEICTKPLTPGAISSSTTMVCETDASAKTFSIASVPNATSYTWTLPSGSSITSGSTIANITTNLGGIAPGTYSLGVAGVNVCGTGTLSVSNITINPRPTISVNNGTVCSGLPFVITPTGAASYAVQGGVFTVSPTANSTYTVTGTSALGCSSANTATASVIVNTLPTIGVNSGSICLGAPFTMTPTGVVSATSSAGSLVVSPTTSTFYTIVGTDANGCISSNTATSNVTVNPLPFIVVGNGTMCAGGNTTLSPSGAGAGGTYTLDGTPGVGTFVVSPAASTSYTVAGTNSFGCVSSNTPAVAVTVYALPVISMANTTMCATKSATLNPTGAGAFGTYTLNGTPGSGPFVVSPASTTNYTVAGTSSVGCVSSNTPNASVTVFTLPVISVNNGTMCAGKSVTLNPSGAGTSGTYTLDGIPGAGPFVVSPAASISFTVAGTNSLGCVSSNTPAASVTVHTLPVLSMANATMCATKSATLNPSGAGISGTYTLNGAPGAGPFVVSPASTTNYTVAGTNSLGCVSSNTPNASVTVFTLPVISVNSGTMCSGSVYTITPGGGTSYTMTGPVSTATSFTINPTTSTSYTVAGTNVAGCVSALPATVNMTVYALPTLSVNSGSICAGKVFTIIPQGGANYTIQPINIITPTNATVSPASTATYAIAGASSFGCLASSVFISTVNVIALPVITASNGVICLNDVFTTTVSGASSYTYVNATTNLNSNGSVTLSPSPAATYTYNVFGTSPVGCISTVPTILTLTVNTLPNVTISSPTNAICDGQSATLTAGGATNYNWGSSTNPVQVVTPSSTTTYTVIGTDGNGCSSPQSFVLTVNPLPTITIVSGAICPGNSYTLTPGGASTYTYSSGSNVVTPVATTSYTVVGTSTAGCLSPQQAVATVSVVNILTVTISGNTTICAGGTINLTANGASTYSWSTGDLTNTVVTTPLLNTTYTVVGSSGTCSDTNTVSITVNALPIISAVAQRTMICLNESVEVYAGGAVNYLWSTASTNSTISVSPSVNTTYTVTGTDVNSCSSSTVVNVLVSPCSGIDQYTGNLWEYGVYPNPNSGEFVIETSQEANIIVLNALGQSVLTQSLNIGKNPVNLDNEVKGIYFVKLRNGNLTKTIKVVKQ